MEVSDVDCAEIIDKWFLVDGNCTLNILDESGRWRVKRSRGNESRRLEGSVLAPTKRTLAMFIRRQSFSFSK